MAVFLRIIPMRYLICPLCSFALHQNEQGLACKNRHQFDRAKEGYFNLLPVHHKNSREPGDAKQQLLARRAFLLAGYFSPLVDELKKNINPNIDNLLDIGCGEGYFTRAFSEHCDHADVYGIDIAKAGIRLASRNAVANNSYVVASSNLLPLADASMDVITRIYAPSKDEELYRVLRDEGILIIVTPGEHHLIGLRQKIYHSIRPHPLPEAPAGFVSKTQLAIGFPLHTSAGDMTASLLDMTPFAWKLAPELRASLVREGLIDQANFQISIYKKMV